MRYVIIAFVAGIIHVIMFAAAFYVLNKKFGSKLNIGLKKAFSKTKSAT